MFVEFVVFAPFLSLSGSQAIYPNGAADPNVPLRLLVQKDPTCLAPLVNLG
jgi:hypothetical protein